MRVLLLLLILNILPTQTIAQETFPVKKGNWIVGGTGGFSRTESNLSGTVTRLNFRPMLSKFVIDNLAIGGSISYNRFSGFNTTNTFLSIGPAITYYLGDENSRAYPFVSSTVSIGRLLDSVTELDLRFSSGIAFSIAKNVAITSEAFFQRTKIYDGYDESQNIYGIDIGITTFIF